MKGIKVVMDGSECLRVVSVEAVSVRELGEGEAVLNLGVVDGGMCVEDGGGFGET